MMPGPLLTVTISESVKKGQRAALFLMVGHSILELVLVIGFTLGLYTILKNPTIIRAIGVFGGGFLLWMGYGLVTDSYRGRVSLNLHDEGAQLRLGPLGPILQGITTSVSNPYWILWWATIGAAYVLASLKYGALGLGGFYVGHILGDFIWYGLIAYAIGTGARFLNDKIYRGILFVCGLFLIVIAVTFIINRPLF
jgi:threonine/homoserine/homoserine lactone efflux protein